jgi:hypothetical protein
MCGGIGRPRGLALEPWREPTPIQQRQVCIARSS